MSVAWGSRWRQFWTSNKKIKTGWLVTAALVIFYMGAVRPREEMVGIANSKATGLAAYRSEPLGLWRQVRFFPQLGAPEDRGIAASRGSNYIAASLIEAPSLAAGLAQDADKREIVRTSALDLVVQKPAEAAEKIRHLTESLGGFLVSSQIGGDYDATFGSLSVRVPANRFDEARAAIRKLGLRVESERIEAQDVTRQYVDEAANLRNLRAEEQQYLAILKQARTVKDTMEVSEKLSAVRGQIGQQQAEFDTLSKQIETVAMNISLRAEAEARVFGLNWRPLYQVKVAMRDGLDGLANYVSTMTAIVFYLPTIILWLATILLGGAIAWRVLRWAGRRAFGTKLPTAATPA